MEDSQFKQVILRLRTRRMVYEIIERIPGIHLRRAHRELGLSLGTVEYHLRQLERFGLVESRREGKKRAYFVTGALDGADEHYLYVLRHRTTRWILQYILEDDRATPKALAQRLDRKVPTISYHLKKLVQAGIVEPLWSGRTKHFWILEPERVRRLLQIYEATFRQPTPPPPSALTQPMAPVTVDDAQGQQPVEPEPLRF